MAQFPVVKVPGSHYIRSPILVCTYRLQIVLLWSIRLNKHLLQVLARADCLTKLASGITRFVLVKLSTRLGRGNRVTLGGPFELICIGIRAAKVLAFLQTILILAVLAKGVTVRCSPLLFILARALRTATALFGRILASRGLTGRD